MEARAGSLEIVMPPQEILWAPTAPEQHLDQIQEAPPGTVTIAALSLGFRLGPLIGDYILL